MSDNNFQNQFNTVDSTSQFTPQDINDNKVMGILAYIGILVLIPIFAAPQSKYARFHANQGLVLFIIELIYGVITTVITSIFTMMHLFTIALIVGSLLGLVSIVFLVFMILGIVNVVNGTAKTLPIIGNVKILK